MIRRMFNLFWFVALIVMITISGCGLSPLPVFPSPTAQATPPTFAPVTPALSSPPQTAITSPSPAAAFTPTRSTSLSTPSLSSGIALYMNPDQLWSIRYPANEFRTETLGDGTMIFRNADRTSWVAIDSYIAKGNEYGNTGEGLRNRARDTLTRLLGKSPSTTTPTDSKDYPWDTGITFSTTDGLMGEAVYVQPERTSGGTRVYGALFAYPAASKQTVFPLLQSIRASFLPITVRALDAGIVRKPLWLAFSTGPRSYGRIVEAGHFIAILSRDPNWQKVSHADLQNADYVSPNSVQQAKIEPTHLWFTADSGVGAHGGCFEVLSFDDQRLKSEAASCNSTPGAGSLRDLNGDGTPEVLLDATEAYVFCYACGVRFVQYKVWRWDGTQLVQVKLTPLPDSAPADLRRVTNRAVELAQAELWQEAQGIIEQALTLAPQDSTVVWDAALIRLHAQARADVVRSKMYPLLDHLFNGDYPSALAVMRPYAPVQLFTLRSPLVIGTVAEGFENSLTFWITRTTSLAIQAKPDLAPAYFIRGWGIYQTSPGNPKVLADVERAAQLNPSEPLFSSSAAYLQTRILPPFASRERIQYAPGATSTTLNLNLTSGTPRAFTLRVLAQQKMNVIVPESVDVAVLGVQDQTIHHSFARGAPVTVTIPQTGDYTIVFFGQGAATATLSIPPR